SFAKATTSSGPEKRKTPGGNWGSDVRDKTMFCLPGSGFPIALQVLEPITTAFPMVVSLKCRKSSV
ncbi:hypothetical protein OFB62_33355, partial [Escherichia coli]|nr:hypothetical protein [Escherichia coli]